MAASTTRPLLRDWFLPDEGIRREVVTADIQSFLGNDATVRPGENVVEGKKINGYWIKAYRNLTTAMVEDLKYRTKKYEKELRKAGRRVDYAESRTWEEPATHPEAENRSPRGDAPYGYPSSSRLESRSDIMDYESSRPTPRTDPYPRTPVADPRHAVGPHGERPMYPPPAPSPYVAHGDPYADDPGYHSSRHGHYPPPSYPGPSGYPGRDPEAPDPRYAPREDQRYPPREVPRYSAREDVRYPPIREDTRFVAEEMRQRPPREDPRYGYPPPPPPPMDDPRFPPPPPPDPRIDPRYQQTLRGDPRYPSIPGGPPPGPQPGYQDPRYSFIGHPGPMLPQGSMMPQGQMMPQGPMLPQGPIPGIAEPPPNPALMQQSPPLPPPPGRSGPSDTKKKHRH